MAVRSKESTGRGRGQVARPPVKERLLNVATRLFARHGFEGTSVQDIVDAAGVTKGAMYHYYGSKDDLLYEVYHQVLTMQTSHLDEIAAGPGTPGGAPAGRRRGRGRDEPGQPGRHDRLLPLAAHAAGGQAGPDPGRAASVPRQVQGAGRRGRRCRDVPRQTSRPTSSCTTSSAWSISSAPGSSRTERCPRPRSAGSSPSC